MNNSCNKSLYCLYWASIQYINAFAWIHTFHRYHQSAIRGVEVCCSLAYERRFKLQWWASQGSFGYTLKYGALKKKKKKLGMRDAVLYYETRRRGFFKVVHTTHPAPTIIRVLLLWCHSDRNRPLYVIHSSIVLYLPGSRCIFDCARWYQTKREVETCLLGSQQRRTWPGCISNDAFSLILAVRCTINPSCR